MIALRAAAALQRRIVPVELTFANLPRATGTLSSAPL
jgi:hypothetical protein